MSSGYNNSISVARILLVDGDAISLVSLKEHLLRQGHSIICAADGHDALSLLEKQDVDLVISDLVLPDMDGIQLIQETKKLHPTLLFIVITANVSIEGAVAAIKQGAFDYVEKSFDPQSYDVTLKRALEFGRISREHANHRKQYCERFSFQNIITQSPAMRQVLDLAARVAASPKTTISLTGESGVGKEVLARAIHFESGCPPGSFVPVNCAAIPESLLESELFGHVRGAFTGAERERDGKFSLACGGTVLLDEIGDMPLSLQTKLLRVLEERTFEKVGDNKPQIADLRVIVATHRNLEELVMKGIFREDLFHRINVVPIVIPPLRERREDIQILVDYFLDLFRQHQGKSLPGISRNAADMLYSYSWPGNIRELRNVLEYAAIMVSDELIRPEHLRLPIATSQSDSCNSNAFDFHFSIPFEDFSQKTIINKIQEIVLKRCGGNKSRASALLKISRNMFYR